MTSKAFLFFMLSSTICVGQSVLTTPVEVTQSAPGSSAVPATNAAQGLPRGAFQARERNSSVSTVPTPGAEVSSEVPSLSRIVGPLTAKSEFEMFAEDATGRRLPVYGRQLFDEVPTTFAPVENVPVPADYVLGPGDQLLIRAWGKIDLDSRVTVDRNGQINLPKVGTLTVAGLRYAQVGKYLHSAISALFKDFELNVSLGELRSIQILVLGNARQPGVYTVSSLSTLVNALFASGGPSATGTMRHIQLRREGLTIAELDIYDLIERGDKSHDARLLPGDVIFIPTIGPQIAISGDVNQPGIYELKGGTTVEAALQDAGGMTSLADSARAVLERIENHSSREVVEFVLDVEGKARVLKDGDLLRVFPLSPKFTNAVTLRGNVAQPGLYPWKEGMRVSDLIPFRSFLITRNYWNQQNHIVQLGSDNPFASWRTDSLDIQRTDAFGGQRTDAFGGQRTDAFGGQRTDQPGGMGSRAVASIGLNSAEINWEYALIERLDEHDLSTHLIPFRLASVIDDHASPDNQLLKAGDVVTILSRADLELPMGKHASFVQVGGEVNAPGVYRVNPGETLRDVVKQAGGLTSHSYLYASVFTRVSARQAQEKQVQQSSEQMQRELISKYANATPQTGQTAADQQAQLAMQQATIARLNSIRPTGRVVLGIKPDAETYADVPDFPLEDGDTFYIPPRLSTVQVAGAVYNANALRYVSGKRLIAYLNDAGGATRAADQKRIFVIRADGTVVSRQSRDNHFSGDFKKLKLLPGDAIIVPEKLQVSSRMANFLQATNLASQTALTAAALSVIK